MYLTKGELLPGEKFVCLAVEEEWGMCGSMELDAGWFPDVSFCLSFDSPGRNRSSRSCAGVALYPDSVGLRIWLPYAAHR